VVCVAVTRGGFGDVWLFKSRTEAFLHPLVQYGDAILTGSDSVRDQYNQLEWNMLRRLAGLSQVAMGQAPKAWRAMAEEQAPYIFDALVTRAHTVPTDPAEICRVVTWDRRLGTVAKKKDTAPVETTTEAPAADAAAKTSNLPAPVKGPKGVPQDAIIAFGTNKEGVAYGPEGTANPKKEGSKTRTRFAMYTEGMTIKQALDAGITTADLVYDKDHGFISWSGGTPGAAAAAAEPETHTNGGGQTAQEIQDASVADQGAAQVADQGYEGEQAQAD
jgi:hypothetical protein